MTTAPQAVESLRAAIQAKINAAGALLEKRLLPAALNMKDQAANQKNSLVLNNFAISTGMVGRYSTMSSEEIAQSLYEAVVADVQSERPQLVWVKPPKALFRRLEKQSEPAKVADPREASSFEERVRAGEKAAAEAKVQAAARKRALELIERFSPLNHRSGRPTYEVPVVDERGRLFRDAMTGATKRQNVDKLRAEWRDRVVKAQDTTKVLEAIKAEQTHIYNALEKEAERI